MRLLTRKQQKAMDRYLMDRGVAVELLMEAAGRGLAAQAERMLSPGGRADLLAGPGMNGGDLYAAARILKSRGFCPEIWECRGAAEAEGPVGLMRRAAKASGVSLHLLEDYPERLEARPRAELSVDGLLGTGFDPERALSSELASALEALKRAKEAGSKVLACDLPSGVTADFGLVHEAAVRADATVTFAAPKAGQMMSPACSYNGELHIASLDLPELLIREFWAAYDAKEASELSFSEQDEKIGGLFRGILDRQEPPKEIRMLDESCFGRRLAEVASDTHKVKQGRALILAGRKGMAGAAALAGEACLRSGAGLVRLSCSEAIYPELFAKLPSIIFMPAAGDTAEARLRALKGQEEQADAVLIGPGLGLGKEDYKLVEAMARRAKKLILDADALTLIAEAGEAGILLLRERAEQGLETLLTPHGGEALRLARAAAPDAKALASWEKAPRLRQVQVLAACCGANVILKGEASLIAAPGGEKVYVNPTGGPGLAKGGSGDILAGLVLGLAAQGPDLFEAAVTACYWHGAAGDAGSSDLGWRGLLPSDTLRWLNEVARRKSLSLRPEL